MYIYIYVCMYIYVYLYVCPQILKQAELNVTSKPVYTYIYV